MKKTILLKMTIDWDIHDGYADEHIIDDSGIRDGLKEGFHIEPMNTQYNVIPIPPIDDGLADDDHLLDLRRK